MRLVTWNHVFAAEACSELVNNCGCSPLNLPLARRNFSAFARDLGTH